MTEARAFPTISDDDRLVVTGASGWMGREVLARLLATRPRVEVLPIASQARTFTVSGARFDAHPWSERLIESWRPTLAIHLAFLTREAVSEFGQDAYIQRNNAITALAMRLYSIPTMRGLVIASSGAAIVARNDTYGSLKSQDEALFTSLGESTGLPTVIARIWSVSGAYCTKPSLFAFSNLLDQTLTQGEVHINAKHEVWRRYVDAGEFLEVCLTAAGDQSHEVIDSAGPLIEIGPLAQLMQDVLGARLPIHREYPSEPADRYFANSPNLESRSEDFGISLTDLAGQVLRSVSQRGSRSRAQ